MTAQPTIGRVVYFYTRAENHPVQEGGDPFPAIITRVHDDGRINVTVLPDLNTPFGVAHVMSVEQLNEQKTNAEYAWDWVPYQKQVQAGLIDPTVHAADAAAGFKVFEAAPERTQIEELTGGNQQSGDQGGFTTYGSGATLNIMPAETGNEIGNLAGDQGDHPQGQQGGDAGGQTGNDAGSDVQNLDEGGQEGGGTEGHAEGTDQGGDQSQGGQA